MPPEFERELNRALRSISVLVTAGMVLLAMATQAYGVVAAASSSLSPLVATQITALGDSTETGSDESSDVVQRDAMDLLKKWLLGHRIEPGLAGETPSGLSWSILPSLSYNPVFGWAFGASITGAGFVGGGPEARPSVISASANYSTQGQLQALARSELYSPEAAYLLSADFRYLDADRSTWGLGAATDDQLEFPMSLVLVRTYATLYRQAGGPVYLGIGYHYDEFNDIEDPLAEDGPTPFSEYSGEGVTSTTAAGVSFNILADTRDSIVNPSSGYYLRGSFRSYTRRLGADQTWQETWASVRLYPRFPSNSQNVLAFWIYGWFSFGPGPYLNLPASGWDTYGRAGRGFLQGRVRAPNQVYYESEYRFRITRDGLLGGVVFYNGIMSTNPVYNVFDTVDHGFGAGLRVKINKNSGTNITIDRAWASEGDGGWFMGLGEVF